MWEKKSFQNGGREGGKGRKGGRETETDRYNNHRQKFVFYANKIEVRHG